MDEQKKQRGGWFRRRGRDISTAPTAPQPGNSGKFTQTMSTWVRAIQERRDNANRTRDLANKLNSELAAILQTCAVQDKALGQRSIRTQVQLSMALGRLTGIGPARGDARCLRLSGGGDAATTTRRRGGGSGWRQRGQWGQWGQWGQRIPGDGAAGGSCRSVASAAGYGQFEWAARRASRSRSGPWRLQADGARSRQAFRETARATQDILRPIQTQGLRLPDVNALASALAALEPLMTWLNQRCEALTATYCAPAN